LLAERCGLAGSTDRLAKRSGSGGWRNESIQKLPDATEDWPLALPAQLFF
jgi:hypothetical protein